MHERKIRAHKQYKEDDIMGVNALFAVQAQEFLEQGHPAEAIALCRQGLEQYPHYVTAYLILARAFLAIGDYASAEQALERGARHSPRSSPTQALRKEIQYALRLKEQQEKYTSTRNSDSTSVPLGLQSALQEASEAVTYIDSGQELPLEHAERTLGTYLRILETDSTLAEQRSAFRSTNLRLIPGLEFTPLRVESLPPSQQIERQRTPTIPEPPPIAEFAEWQHYQESLRQDQATELPREKSGTDIMSLEMLKPNIGYSRPPMPEPLVTIDELERLPELTEENSKGGDDDIASLAQRLMHAKMPEAQELLGRQADIPEYLKENLGETVSDSQPNAGTVIISETMARIYESQGALAQALYAYKALAAEATVQQNQKRALMFTEKVRLLQARLDAQLSSSV
ncbi:MAG: tetratricopeptide repeat protein [Bacteroidota bacterium]|nr:tetratricopeptide repeat protein [Candidatus Kapabacteria bacterium]MDW8220958.1 tetratricopeptide repeat protein [Bacteroidota bacterium]